MPRMNKLESRIQSAMKLIPEEKYPIVIELAGMPRLGKTTFTDSLIDLLQRSGYTTILSSNATHSSPIHDRWSSEFSAWTLFSFLKNYLELGQSSVPLIVADRGLFDSIIWLRIKAERGLLGKTSLSTLREITLMKPWLDSLCLVLAFVGDPELILRRHLRRKLYEGESHVSTSDLLQMQKSIIESEAEYWIQKGIRVKLLDVGDEPIESMNSKAVERVLTSLEVFAKNINI